MKWRTGSKALLFGAIGVLPGCATVPKGAGFNDVQKDVAQRTGHLVQWQGQTADDAAVDAAVRSMLRKELMADEAVQIALLNNRNLQATFEDLGIAQADLVQAGLLKNPVFAASWRFPDRSPNGTNAEYSITQDFLDLLILPLRKRVAQREFERTKLSIAHQVLQLAADVKTAFFMLQARAQLAGRLRLMVDINQTATELAQRQLQGGTLNDLGFANQQAVYDQSKVEVAQAEAQLATDREKLNRLLGLWGDQTLWKVADRLPAIPEREISLEHLERLAMRQRLDLAAARAEVVTLGQALAVTKAYRYVTSVEVGVDTERDTGGQRVTGPTLNLQLPIFDQGQAQIAKVMSQFRQIQRRYEAMAIDARSEVREARDRLIAQRSLAEYYKVLLPKRIHVLNLTLQQYNGMLKGTYDLLLAKQAEVDTERAYIETWRDYWIARTDLERALGGRLPEASTADTQPPAATTQPGMPNPEDQPHDMGNMHDMKDMKGAQP